MQLHPRLMRQPHKLPTHRLTAEAVLTWPSSLTDHLEPFSAQSARTLRHRLTHTIFLRSNALILPFCCMGVGHSGRGTAR
jgi:hypothetical protein